MAQTETTVLNSALIKIGSDLVTSIDDDTKAARLGKVQFPVIRDDLLINHKWNFAVKRVELAALSSVPVQVAPQEDFTFQFQLPNDYLRLDDTDIDFPEFYVVEGDKILSFRDTAKIKYIAQITDVSLWDKAFAEVMAWKLAADLSFALKQTVTLTQLLVEQAERKLREARSIDAQSQGRVRQFEANEEFDQRN